MILTIVNNENLSEIKDQIQADEKYNGFNHDELLICFLQETFKMEDESSLIIN